MTDIVLQQADVLRTHLDLRIGMYYGEMNVDGWSKVKWLKEWESHDVMVMTPQILLDILRHGSVTVSTERLVLGRFSRSNRFSRLIKLQRNS